VRPAETPVKKRRRLMRRPSLLDDFSDWRLPDFETAFL
jgi:hypothetical protein